MEIVIYLGLGLVIGAIISFLVFKLSLGKKKMEIEKVFNQQLDAVLIEKRSTEDTLLQKEERLNTLSLSLQKSEDELTQLREKNDFANQRIAKAEVEYRGLQEKLQSQKAEMEELQKKFTTEFENIAHKILRKNTEDFTATNQKNMGELLKPMKEKFESFEKKVEDTYLKSKNDQVDLQAELKKLSALNIKISEEANNLTKALKGDVKKQGNWGEVVLERILERSGLTEGQEYEREVVQKTDIGRVVRPDVIVKLPDEKHIIIDSKVSLLAYEKAVNSDETDDREKFIKEHLLSLKNHIKGLSDKHYQTLRDVNSPDFVLLFIPIEASFSIAVQEDQELFSFAWDRKVVIVSPSTLLATLKTIASIWQQENQTRNAIEIARQGGALYDKFVGFIEDLEKIGNNLKTTQSNYEKAMNKLTTGKGNLVKGVEKLKSLGAKASKEIEKKMLDE